MHAPLKFSFIIIINLDKIVIITSRNKNSMFETTFKNIDDLCDKIGVNSDDLKQ